MEAAQQDAVGRDERCPAYDGKRNRGTLAGAVGQPDPELTEIQLTAEAICHAYIRAVQQATGQVRLFDNEITQARRLAVEGCKPADVTAATLLVCDKALERRAGVPALADVARAIADA